MCSSKQVNLGQVINNFKIRLASVNKTAVFHELEQNTKRHLFKNYFHDEKDEKKLFPIR